MPRSTFKLILFFVLLIVILSIIDLFSQLIGLIPVLGDVADLLTNTTMELIQIILGSIIALTIKKIERL